MANQGCQVFNIKQFTALIAQLNAIELSTGVSQADVQAKVQAIIDEAMNPILGIQSAINRQIAILAPLTSVPNDLGSAISWITTFINSSIIVPHSNLLLQEAAMITEISALTAAIASLESRIGISITIPTVPHC